MLSTYLDYRVYAQNLTTSLQHVAAEPNVARDQQYYQQNIGKVTSVDDFVGNYRLFSFAMKASGLEDMTYAKAFMRKVLTSDLSDSHSFVNSLTDPRFKAFAQNFSFTTKGAVTTSATAQTSSQMGDTVSLYTSKVGSGSFEGTLETAYYESHIGDVKNMQDLVNDQQLYNYVLTAYGIDSKATQGTLAQSTASQNALASVLESDTSNPNSTAAQLADGSADASDLPSYAQSAAKVDATSTAYTAVNGRDANVIYYESTIGSIHSVDSFLADPTLVSVAETAYGVDPAAYSNDDLKKILTSDLSDPMSVANQLGTSAKSFAQAFNFTTTTGAQNPFLQMAKDFNFDSTGTVATQRQVQSQSNLKSIETLYLQQAGTDATSQANAKTESTYYATTIASTSSIDDLLSNPRMVSYITKAYGIDSSKLSTGTLRNVLTSDLTNSKSTANTMGTAYRQLSAAFNFTTTGGIARDPKQAAEAPKNVQMLSDSYLRQTMEDEAGDTNEGVKLALYFQRKAPTITSAYQILADSALSKVVKTALNIPSSTSSQDIDIQAKQITNRLKLADLKDPAKLNKFISQFATLYDFQNNSSSSDSSITSLFV